MSDRVARGMRRSVVWVALGSLLFVGLRGALAQEVVYTNDFEAPVGEEWFGAPIARTPTGRRFIGRHAPNRVRLALDALPPHASVRVQLALYVIGGWDGNDAFGGPDIWQMSFTDGPTLVRTTFTHGPNRAFPDEPVERNTLGYTHSSPSDSVYAIDVEFPHSDASLDIEWTKYGALRLWDESWGIDDIVVTVSDAVVDEIPMPGAPVDPQATAANRGAVVTWTPSPDAGSGLDRYEVVPLPYRLPYDTSGLAVVDANTTTAAVTGLRTDGVQSYSFRVMAIDTRGNVAISGRTETVFPLWEPLPGVNLLVDGEFDDQTVSPWQWYGDATVETDTTEVYSGTASLSLRPRASGETFWASGVYHEGLQFRQGVTYTWSAHMKAEAPRRVNMKAELDHTPWEPYGERQQYLTTEWREYVVRFSPRTDVIHGEVIFHIAGSDVPFWIDNVRVYEGPYLPSGTEPALSILSPATDREGFPKGSIAFELAHANHETGWAWQADQPFPHEGLAGGNTVLVGNTVSVVGLSKGRHTFYAALVDGSGSVLQPSVVAAAHFSVHGDTPYILDDARGVTDDGFIARWLMLDDPIFTGLTSRAAVDEDFVAGEGFLLPADGDVAPVTVGGGTHTWTRANLLDIADMGTINDYPTVDVFTLPQWGDRNLSTQYLVTYLRWDVTGDVTFRFGSGDSSESYFNRNRLHRYADYGDWVDGDAGSVTVPVVGGEWNVLAVGSHELYGTWGFSAHADPAPDAVDNTGQYASLVDFGAPVSLSALSRQASGGEVAVTLSVGAPVVDIDALAFEISFSPIKRVLEYDRIEVAGTLLDGAAVTPNTQALGRGSWLVNLPGVTGVSGSGALATVYFRSVGDDTDIATITLESAELSNTLAEPIRAHVATNPLEVNFDCVRGDSNGDGQLNVTDVTKIERIVARLDAVPASACADASGDGSTDVLDVTATERLVVGLPAVAQAPQVARVPAVRVTTVSDTGGVVALRLAVRGVLNDVDAASFDLTYLETEYELLALNPIGWSADASRIDNDSPGRAIRVLNAAGIGGTSLSGGIAEIVLRRRSPDAHSPVALDVHIGDASGRSLLRRSFSISMWRVPEHTAALPNFPNPFNPETWIPFDLAESADVVIRVYSVGGALVRTLNLGSLPAGAYADRSRAAHWDGRNDAGEQVAGGVYHYEIRAGEYRATRRMVILK